MKKSTILLGIILSMFFLNACTSSQPSGQASEAYFEFDSSTGYVEKFHPKGVDGGMPVHEYIVVPEQIQGKAVVGIGHMAFNGAGEIKGVELPPSVQVIDSYAFYGAKNMVTFTMDNSVVSIGDSAFRDCVSLKSIKFSSSLESIGKDAFNGCQSIEFIELPDSLKSIDSYAFAFMRDLEYIDLGEGVETIGKGAFSSSGSFALEGISIVFPESLRMVEEEAFYSMMITDVTNYSQQIRLAKSENNALINPLIDKINQAKDPRGYYYLTQSDSDWIWETVELEAMKTPINFSFVILLLVGVGYILAGTSLMIGKKRMVNASVEIIPFLLLFLVLFVQMGTDPKGSFYFQLAHGSFGMIHVTIILLIAFLYHKFRHEYSLFKWDYDEVLNQIDNKLKANKIKYKKIDDTGHRYITKIVFQDERHVLVSKRMGETLLQMKSVRGLDIYKSILEIFNTPVKSRRRVVFLSTGFKHILIGLFLIYMSGTL